MKKVYRYYGGRNLKRKQMKRIKDTIKDFFEALFTYLLFLSPVIIIALVCIVYAYTLIKYGNSKVTDIPVWAYFILRGGK